MTLALALVAGGCAARGGPGTHAAPARSPCPTALTALTPRDVRSVLFLRPREAYAHPTLGRALRRMLDARGERALLERAERLGYDPRGLERAVVAYSPRGALYLGAGQLDGRTVLERHWERLLEPRARVALEGGGGRVEGVLVETPTALRTRPECALVSYAEGTDLRDVDRIALVSEATLATPATPAPAERAARGDGAPEASGDPPALLRYRTRELPRSLAAQAGSLVGSVRALQVQVDAREQGLRVALVLRGALPDDAPARLRSIAAALASSPLGELAGAAAWLAPARLEVERFHEGARCAALVPWSAVLALADALRGDVTALLEAP